MSTGDIQLFTPSGELTIQAMRLYIRGALKDPDKVKVKAYLDDNPFEAEALEGMATAGENAFSQGLEGLRNDIQVKATTPSGGGGPVVKMAYWQAAAAVFIMVSVFAASIFMLERNYVNPDSVIALNELKKETGERITPLPPSDLPESKKQVESERADAGAVPDADEVEVAVQSASSIDDAEVGMDQVVSIPDLAEPEEEVEKYPGLADINNGNTANRKVREWPSEAELAEESAEELQIASNERAEQRNKRFAYVSKADSATETLEEEAEPVYLVYGTVLSGGGIPLSGVSISVLGENDKSFETDREGDFKITVDEPTDILRFSYRGISDIDVPVAGRSHLIVTLSSSGNRVQAIGADGTELPASANASPGGGYSAYKTYLENKLGSVEADGRIVVEFTVSKSGDLIDFEIIRGIGETADKALIEAMQNGPKWQPAFEQGMAVPSRTRYRIRLR